MEITIIIKSEKKERKVVLREPLFNDFRMASMVLNAKPEYIDRLGAGSSLVQHCWLSGDEDLKNGDESENPEIAKAYTTLCLDAYNELYVGFQSEVKKK